MARRLVVPPLTAPLSLDPVTAAAQGTFTNTRAREGSAGSRRSDRRLRRSSLCPGTSRGLVAPAAVAPPDAGVRFQFTLGVEDVDAMCERLRERGVELLNGPMDRP